MQEKKEFYHIRIEGEEARRVQEKLNKILEKSDKDKQGRCGSDHTAGLSHCCSAPINRTTGGLIIETCSKCGGNPWALYK
ncbi:hypothetical protein ACFLZ9_01430 [Patescibacteria group bacterium]